MKGGGRAIIAGLVLSAVGLTYIASDEGYRDTAYNDGGGVQTTWFSTPARRISISRNGSGRRSGIAAARRDARKRRSVARSKA